MKIPLLNKILIDVIFKQYLFYLEVGGEPITFNQYLELYNEFLHNENFNKIYNNHLHELEEQTNQKVKKKGGKK